MSDINMFLTSPPRVIQEITQNSHGFAVGEALKISGTNTFAKAQADSAANSRVVGVVSQVVNANEFVLTTHGRLLSGVPAAAAGTIMYLSDSVAGALTSTAPASNVTPVLVVLENAISAVVLNALQGGGSGVAFIPLAGTGIGAPVTGDIEITDGGTHKIYQDDGSVQNMLLMIPGLGSFVRSVGPTTTYSLAATDTSGVIIEASDGVDESNLSIFKNVLADAATYPFVFTINTKRIQFNGQAAPTVTDDNTLGYGVDSFWIYSGALYICTNASTGTAVWNPVGGGSGTINTGNQYRLPYYSTNPTGTTLSEAAAITANSALISDANGVPTHSPTTAAQLAYLQGISSPAIGDIPYFDGTNFVKLSAGTSGYILQANGAAAPSWVNKIPSAFITAQVDNATTTEANVTGLSFAVETNSTYFIVIGCALECSGVGGIFFGHTYPTSNLMLSHWGRASAGNTVQNLGNLYSGTGTGLISNAFNAVAAATGYYCAHLVLRTTASGTYQLTFAAAAGSQTASVRAGSGLFAIKIG